jgi:hypothetical protein
MACNRDKEKEKDPTFGQAPVAPVRYAFAYAQILLALSIT